MTPVDGSLPEVHVALEGHFNPLIIQPDWFLRHDLIDEQDYDTLIEEQSAVVSPEFTANRYPWVTVETTRTDMVVSSTPGSESPDRVRELVIGIFTLLSHTPITSLTLSHSSHMALEEDRWSEITDRLAPRAPMEELLGSDVELRSIGQRSTRGEAEVAVYLEPSAREEYVGFLQVDETHTLEEDQPESATRALEILDQRWAEVRDLADHIRSTLFDL